jgi:Ca2+-binding EF-hand superfamily protein
VRIEPCFSPFVNLPRKIVKDLRCAVSEVSESGYSVTLQELEQLLQLSLHEYLSNKKIREYCNALFSLFNADALPECDEIDSFELLGTLCLTSGMTLKEKVQFLFDLVDLNEKGELCVNEVSFAFRSLVSGTRKIAIDAAIATNEDIDQVALEAFDLIMPDNLKFSLAMANNDTKVTRQQFCDYVFNCPEASSFMNCYDDIVVEETRNKLVAHASGANATPLRLMTKEEYEQETKAPSRSEPWRDQLRFLRPDNAAEKTSPPMDGLSLEYICGRNSGTEAVYTSDGDVLYAAGSMVVKCHLVADDGGYKQEYFNEHAHRVSSLAISAANSIKLYDSKLHDGMGDMVASSDTDGDDCKVCVWSSYTLSSIVTFSTRHQVSIS